MNETCEDNFKLVGYVTILFWAFGLLFAFVRHCESVTEMLTNISFIDDDTDSGTVIYSIDATERNHFMLPSPEHEKPVFESKSRPRRPDERLVIPAATVETNFSRPDGTPTTSKPVYDFHNVCRRTRDSRSKELRRNSYTRQKSNMSMMTEIESSIPRPKPSEVGRIDLSHITE